MFLQAGSDDSCLFARKVSELQQMKFGYKNKIIFHLLVRKHLNFPGCLTDRFQYIYQ